MSTTQALFIFLLLATGLTLVGWLLVRGWSPEQLPQWAGLIWGLIALMTLGPRLLPPSIRWSETLSVVQGILGVVVVVLSIKCLILLLRDSVALTVVQRRAAYLGLTPLVIGALMALFFFWMAGAFSSKK